MTYDYVVIGAGVAGMTAALLLARRGCRVALVEQRPQLAPLIRGFSRQGLHFDTGFHYAGGLGAGEVLDRFFTYLGVQGLTKKPFSADGFDVCRFERPDFEFAFPIGEERVRQRLVDAFPREVGAIDGYLAAVRRSCERFPYLNPDATIDPMSPFGTEQERSLREVLDGLTADRTLKGLLSLHCLLHGTEAEHIPFALHAGVIGPYYRSVHGFVGGGQALARSFEAALRRAGVDLLLGSAVQSIRCSDTGGVKGVTLANGEQLESAGCVATLHPHLLLDLVPHGLLRPAYRHRLQRLEETMGGLTLYAHCDGPVPELEGVNLFLVKDPAAALRLSEPDLENCPLYVTAAEPTGTVEGAAGFLVICPLPFAAVAPWGASRHGSRPPEYLAYKAAVVRQLQGRLERLLPDLSRRVRSVDLATPLTVRDYVPSPFGSMYGVQHRLGQVNPFPKTRVEGLYLAGQAVAAPGLLGGMLSSFLAGGAIFGHNLLREELQRCN